MRQTHSLPPVKVCTLAALAAATTLLAAPRARATTVLLVAHDYCTEMLNARLPEDMLMLQDFDRNPAHWMSPESDPGTLHWLAWSMGTPVDMNSPVHPVRDVDIISSFYAALAGTPNSFFANGDFNHDGIEGGPEDIDAFWNSLGRNNPNTIPLNSTAALSFPVLLALGVRRRR